MLHLHARIIKYHAHAAMASVYVQDYNIVSIILKMFTFSC